MRRSRDRSGGRLLRPRSAGCAARRRSRPTSAWRHAGRPAARCTGSAASACCAGSSSVRVRPGACCRTLGEAARDPLAQPESRASAEQLVEPVEAFRRACFSSSRPGDLGLQARRSGRRRGRRSRRSARRSRPRATRPAPRGPGRRSARLGARSLGRRRRARSCSSSALRPARKYGSAARWRAQLRRPRRPSLSWVSSSATSGAEQLQLGSARTTASCARVRSSKCADQRLDLRARHRTARACGAGRSR